MRLALHYARKNWASPYQSPSESSSEQMCFLPSFICKFGFEDVPFLQALSSQHSVWIAPGLEGQPGWVLFFPFFFSFFSVFALYFYFPALSSFFCFYLFHFCTCFASFCFTSVFSLLVIIWCVICIHRFFKI